MSLLFCVFSFQDKRTAFHLPEGRRRLTLSLTKTLIKRFFLSKSNTLDVTSLSLNPRTKFFILKKKTKSNAKFSHCQPPLFYLKNGTPARISKQSVNQSISDWFSSVISSLCASAQRWRGSPAHIKETSTIHAGPFDQHCFAKTWEE